MTVVKSGTVVPDGRLTRMHNRKRVGAFCFGVIVMAIVFGLCGAMDAWANDEGCPVGYEQREVMGTGERAGEIVSYHCIVGKNGTPPSQQYAIPSLTENDKALGCSTLKEYDGGGIYCGKLWSFSISTDKNGKERVMGYFLNADSGKSVRLYELFPVTPTPPPTIKPKRGDTSIINPPQGQPPRSNYTATPTATPTSELTITPTSTLTPTSTPTSTPTPTPACVWEDGVCVIYPEGTATATPTPTATPQSPYGSVTPTPTGTSYPTSNDQA